MKKKLLLSAALLLALTGCGWKGEGTIVGKDHDAAYSKKSCSYVGKVMTCKKKHYNEEWELTVKDRDGNLHEVDVHRSYWDSVREGDTFDNRNTR